MIIYNLFIYPSISRLNPEDKSHLVHIIVDVWDGFLKSLSLPDANDQFLSLGVFKRHALDDCPVVEHVLGEGFSLGVSSKSSSETERFRDWKISFDLRIKNFVPR